MDLMEYVDLTMLRVGGNFDDVQKLIDKADEQHCASACIPPCYVRQAKKYIDETGKKVKLCTVIGFPNGYNDIRVKVFETRIALDSGADEIDLVVNIGWELNEQYGDVREEIKRVKEVCDEFSQNREEKVILKVIVESAALPYDTIREMCHIIYECGADYIKTSTGFHPEGGAMATDLLTIREEIDNINHDENISDADGLKIKASGGIRVKSLAQTYIDEYNVSRIGASGLSD